MRWIKLSVITWVFFCMGSLQAKAPTTADNAVTYSIPQSATKLTTINVVPLANRQTEYFIIEAMVNGKGPFLFMVDTGSNDTVLTQSLAEDLQLPFIQKRKFLTHNGYQTVQYYKIDNIKFGKAELSDYQVKTYTEPSVVTHFRNQKKLPIDGILGLGAFYHYLLTFDYANKQIEMASGTLSAEEEGVIELEDISRTPVISILFKDKNNARLYINCLIDTGFSGYFAMPASVKTLPFKVLKAEKTLLRVWGQQYVIKKVQVDVNVYLGKKVIVSPIVLYGNDIYGTSNTGFGLVGLYALHPFQLTIDQKNKRVQLK